MLTPAGSLTSTPKRKKNENSRLPMIDMKMSISVFLSNDEFLITSGTYGKDDSEREKSRGRVKDDGIFASWRHFRL